MLGQQINQQDRIKTYLNIKNGAIVRHTPQGEESYKYVEGVLASLTQKERTFRNEKVIYWYLDLWDEESGERYSLGFPFASNSFKSIVLQLASEDGLQAIKSGSMIRIEPYSKNGYDKVQVWGEGVKLNWITKQLPLIESRQIGSKTIKDDSKRMEYICSLCNRIAESIPFNR